MNNNFSHSFPWFSCFSCSFITIFAVSQSTYEEWNQKILLFFLLQLKLIYDTQCKAFSHWVHSGHKQWHIRSRKACRFLEIWKVWRENDLVNSSKTKTTNKNTRQQGDDLLKLAGRSRCRCIRELKQVRQGRLRERCQEIVLMNENNGSARPTREFYNLVHFYDVLVLTATWIGQIWGYEEDGSA